LVAGPRWVPDTKTDWPPACEDVSPGAEERTLLEAITQQLVKTVTEDTSLCMIVICEE
jgi:hypothetical protein